MSLKNKKILITCGPTWTPIDAMRVISNRSTGAMGQQLAEDFKKAGAKVTLIEGPVDRSLRSKTIRILKFAYFDELASLIKKELKKKYDVCIHAAAVSDYKVKHPRRSKLSSRLKQVKLDLVPTAKIIEKIKRSHPEIYLVGFKFEPSLTSASAKRKANGLFSKSRCDLVVANSVRGRKYSGFILNRNKEVLGHKRSRKQVSQALVNLVKEAS